MKKVTFKRLPSPPPPDLAPELEAIATAVGEMWAAEVASSLRAVNRELVGEWPGTLGEARMRIRLATRIALERFMTDTLARVAIVAARRSWKLVCEADVG